MGSSGSRSGLGFIGLRGLLPGSQLQTDGAVPCSAILLLPAGEMCQTGTDGARVSLFIFVSCFLCFPYFWGNLVKACSCIQWFTIARLAVLDLSSYFFKQEKMAAWSQTYYSSTITVH